MDVVLYRQSETLLLYVVSDSGRKRKALFYPRSGEWYVFSRNGREITETALGRRVIEACIAAQAPQPADGAVRSRASSRTRLPIRFERIKRWNTPWRERNRITAASASDASPEIVTPAEEERHMEMKLTHRMVLFAFLGDADHTAHERIVGTVMILRANWWRSYKARNLDADKVAQLSGLDTAAVLTAAASLVARGWFEMAEDGDGYGLAPERLAQAQARHEEHNQRMKERAKQARAEAKAA